MQRADASETRIGTSQFQCALLIEGGSLIYFAEGEIWQE
jgi:hypothetical protein